MVLKWGCGSTRDIKNCKRVSRDIVIELMILEREEILDKDILHSGTTCIEKVGIHSMVETAQFMDMSI
jgi:hypothetical protein